MKSLTAKLTLAFLLVAVTSVGLVAILIRRSAQNELNRLVLSQNRQDLLVNLLRYYQQNNSWKGVERLFNDQLYFGPNDHEQDTRGKSSQELFAVTDQEGNIIFGGASSDLGRKLRIRDLRKGYPLSINNDVVGYLVYLPEIDRWYRNTPEGEFISAVNRATIISASAAVVLAVILGGVLARTLTRRLRLLTNATKELAKGKFGHQVEVTSEDEIGVLANSFNQMSSDLAQSNDLRRQMTADIAHDLRSPLTVILGYTEALYDGKLEANPEIFEIMYSEAKHLSILIEDLKTLSLADAGELPLNKQLVAPFRLLQRANDTFRLQADKKKIEIIVDATKELPEINIDIERMAQVLGNLVSNALRFTPENGQIKLEAHYIGNIVELQVIDTGSGIAPQDLPYIFERSFRGDKVRNQSEGETGLGLAIAKSLVIAMGGSISVESDLGKGTKFTIIFPVDK